MDLSQSLYCLTQTFKVMNLLTSVLGRISQAKMPKKVRQLMRLTTVILLTTCLTTNAKTINQTITLSTKNASIINVFSEIRKQTGYDFLFKSSWMQGAKPVTISVKNSSLQEVLTIVFKDQPLNYQILDKSVIITPKVVPTDIEKTGINPIDVKGKVINEKSQPVAGVSVTIKGTTIITSTDSNGEFSLSSVDRDAILVFTSVNLETFELKVSGKTELLVNLKTKITALGDVIVTVSTGYEDIPKERATGSFSKIDNEALNQQVGTNILKRLDGVASALLFDTKSVSPQKKLNFSIRGASTINGPQDPLIVLDGFIYEGNINNINPNLIESVTVLKDAAAASIWGARAGNGVLVITSKKGSFSKKLQIELNANVIVTSKPDLFYLPQMSSSDYVNFEQFLYAKGYFNSQFTNLNRPAITPAVEIFRKRSQGLISANDSAQQIDALKNADIRDEYNRHFYTNSIVQQYSVNLRGGTQNNAYILSVGLDKNTTETYGKIDKLNIRLENTYKPVKDLEVSFSVYYTNGKNNSGRPAYNNTTIDGRQVPYLTFANETSESIPIALSLRNIYTDTAGAGKLLNWKYYPLEDYKHDKTTNSLEEFYVNTGLNYKIFKFLSVDLKYQYQKQQTDNTRIQDIESYGARNLINQFSQLNRSTGIVKYVVPLGGIKTITDGIIESQTLRAQLNYNLVKEKHSIYALAGSESRQTINESTFNTIYGYNEDPLTYGNVDYTNRYPTFVRGLLQTIPGAPRYTDITNRFISLYSNLSYTYNRKYIFSISARKDGSNIFGVNTNDKWKPFWSTGLAWNLSDEAFFKSNFISSLRIRSTYGYSGNVDLSKSALPVARYLSPNSFTSFPVARINTVNNPELRWERVRTFNFGIDFSLSSRMLSGSIEFYSKKGSDLYALTPIDYTTIGFNDQITSNVADMTGNGIDISLQSTIIKKSFEWNASLFFTYNQEKTTNYFTPQSKLISTLIGSGNVITPVIGKPLYSIAAYKWGGLDSLGNPQGYANGQKTTDYIAITDEANIKGLDGNVVYVGSAKPTLFGSVINTFSYKGISVSINISYKGGYYFKKSSLSYGALIGGSGHKEYSARWQKPGDELKTNIPSLIYPNNSERDAFYSDAEINVLKGDHLRIQYINLSYTLNNEIWKKNPFKDLQVYFNASNLGIIWRANKQGLDPEYPSTLYPAKSMAIGIRTTL